MREERKDHLTRRRAAFTRDRLDRFGARLVAPLAASERRVGGDRDAVLAAIRQLVRLDGLLPEMVEQLIAGDRLAVEDGARFFEVVDVEIAHPERADLPVGDELLERGHRLAQRYAAAPVQHVEVEVVRTEPFERRLARANRPLERRVRRQHFARDEELFARQTADHLTDQPFGGTVAVHLRRVDVHHAELDPAPQRALRLFRRAAAHGDVPGPLADDRHVAPGRPERPDDHGKKPSGTTASLAERRGPPTSGHSTPMRALRQYTAPSWAASYGTLFL